MKRLATIAAAVILIVTTMPAATVCCLSTPVNRMAAIHASMACCTDHCKMSNANSSRDQDLVLTAAPTLQARTGRRRGNRRLGVAGAP